MHTPRHALIVCALLALGACGAAPQTDGAAARFGGEVAIPQGVAATPKRTDVQFGSAYRFSEGVTVSVSSPRSFRPSDAAYPHSERAVAFEIAVRNEGHQPYRLSGLSAIATVDGIQAKQVLDAVQGFSGNADAGKDVLPGRDVRFTVAFAMPTDPAPLKLALRTSPSSGDIAQYCGRA